MFKPESIGEFLLLEYIKENFNLNKLTIKSLSHKYNKGYVLEVKDNLSETIYIYMKKNDNNNNIKYSTTLESFSLCDLR